MSSEKGHRLTVQERSAEEAEMGKVTCEISMSLDGFIAGPNVRVGNGMGDDGDRLHAWRFGANTEIDDAIVDERNASTGAVEAFLSSTIASSISVFAPNLQACSRSPSSPIPFPTRTFGPAMNPSSDIEISHVTFPISASSADRSWTVRRCPFSELILRRVAG